MPYRQKVKVYVEKLYACMNACMYVCMYVRMYVYTCIHNICTCIVQAFVYYMLLVRVHVCALLHASTPSLLRSLRLFKP